MYNTTNLTSADTIYDIFLYANTTSSNTLIGGLMIAIFFIMLMMMKRWDFDEALLSSGFVCFVLSMLLSYAKLVNIIFPLLFLAITAFTGFYVFVVKKK
jgi:hypothetical protein